MLSCVICRLDALYAELVLELPEEQRGSSVGELVNLKYADVAVLHMWRLQKRLEALAWQRRSHEEKLLRTAGSGSLEGDVPVFSLGI